MKTRSTELPDLKVVKRHCAILEGYNEKFVFAEIEEIVTGWFICFIVCGEKRREIATRDTMRKAKRSIIDWYKENVPKMKPIWKAWKWEETDVPNS